MRKIANILAEKTSITEPFYNIVDNRDKLIDGIPTLVIGWDFTKSVYPTANIIDWKIDDMTYWTFGGRERRSVYDKRIADFKNMVISMVKSSIYYEYVSILSDPKEKKAEFLAEIESNDVDVYSYNNMCYMCIPDKKVVYGIYLKDFEYINRDIKSFFRDMFKNDNIRRVDSNEEDVKGIRYMFKSCNYMVPYMLSV